MQFLYEHLVAFALALFAVIACALAVLLLKKRITQFAVELRHRIRLVSLAVFLSFAALATIFAQKPETNDVDGASNPQMMSPPQLFLPNAADATTANGLCITGFSLLTNGVEIASSWPAGVSMLSLKLLYSRYLLSNDWVCIDSWAPLASATSDVRTVAFGGAFTNAPSGFFTLSGLDADGDADGDGIPNSVEIEAGLDPASADTDGDGLSDGEEYACLDTSAGASVPWIRDADITVYAYGIPATYSGAGLYVADLPFRTMLAGLQVNRVAVDLKGVVYFGSETNLVGLTSRGSIDLSTDTGLDCVTVAPYWKDLGITSLSLASVRFATATVGTERVFVLLVTCMGTASSGGMCNLHYQITVGEDTPGVVNVKYWSNQEMVMSRYAAIGAQGPRGGDGHNFPKLSHFYGPRLPVMNGATFTYRLGCGSDPKCYDTDGDGLPDGWELEYGLNPNDATGANGAAGDADGDGRANIDEYCLDLDPRVADSEPQVPEGERKTLTFNIYGDYAAWEMTIAGLGPTDSGIRRVTMGAPDSPQNAQVTLRKGNAYRLSMRWLNSNGHGGAQAPWYCWQAKIDGFPSSRSYNDYSNSRLPGNEIVVGDGWIAENAAGLLTSHVHECTQRPDGSFGGGNVAEGLVATLYVLGDPMLVPDYDRDGKIDDADISLARQGAVLRFWINDDEDHLATEGKYAESPRVNLPGAETGMWEFDRRDPDFAALAVNGLSDLLDFTPILADASHSVGILPEALRQRYAIRLRQHDGAVNVVWSNLSKGEAGNFQKTSYADGFGAAFAAAPESAGKENVSARGLQLPADFAARSVAGNGIFCLEGCGSTTGALWMEVLDGATVVCSNLLEMSISPVEWMYRLASLRGAADDPSLTVPVPALPLNMPTCTNGLDVFFTHGFNVNAEAARAWGAEIFKRLWQSGSNARFHMLPWRGDYRWVEGVDATTTLSALHYPHNAWFAQRTGGALKRYLEAAQPDSSKRILMTQSLGNMVACEALREGLQVAQYYMFDAALPSEAIDGTLRAEGPDDGAYEKYVRPEWRDYTNLCWASNWHRVFEDVPIDSRRRMGWANRFQDALANAGEVFNYYSSGDSVFTEEENIPSLLDDAVHFSVGRFLWIIPYPIIETTFDNHCWQKQEVLKGMATLAGTLSGGWGFNVWEEQDPDTHDERSVYYSPEGAAEAVCSGTIAIRPAFDVSDAVEMMNPNASEDDVFLALAKHVPALSSPVGGVDILHRDRDFDLNSNNYRNGWGRNHTVFGASWLHSDMKDMAYFYVHKLYDQLVTRGMLK